MIDILETELQSRLSLVKLLALDVDGVLTDGGLYYTETGEELKKFNVKDGMGLKLLMQAGIEVAIITTSTSASVSYRAKKLGISHVFLGIEEKLTVLQDLCHKLNITLEQVAYIGDDINDVPILEKIGCPLTVGDAMNQNKNVSMYVTESSGGNGAVREICDLMLQKVHNIHETKLAELRKQQEGAIYSKIWNAFNQTSLEILEEESKYFPQEIEEQKVRQYFDEISHYKSVNLLSLTEEDKSFIKTAGLSLPYLKQNLMIINKEGVSKENTNQDQINLLLTAAQDGYIYAICPTRGEILKSNRSFFLMKHASRSMFGYRFVGNEVFYLIVISGLKECLYFPRLELIVYLQAPPKLNYAQQQGKKNPDTVRDRQMGKILLYYKNLVVCDWMRVRTYLLNLEEPKKVGILGYVHSTGHHVINDLSPIQRLLDNDCLNKVDKFIVHIQEFYGGIEEIFPEINLDQVQRIPVKPDLPTLAPKLPKLINNEILDNNLYAFGLVSDFVDESLAKRIYKTSLKKCSSLVVEEIKDAQEKCFPLLWINFRTHKRSWKSQIEGTANIVKNLAQNFPNLGVVVDGFTRTDMGGILLVNDQEEEMIKQEQDFFSKVQSHFPEGVKVYNLIGCPMYEVIAWAYATDLYFISHGSALAKVLLIANKPGVVHANKRLGQHQHRRRENSIKPVYLHSEYQIDDTPTEIEKGGRPKDWSYDFDWRVAYEELFKIASSITRD